MQREAVARGWPESSVRELVHRPAGPWKPGMLGKPHLNVLFLSFALNTIHSAASSAPQQPPQ